MNAMRVLLVMACFSLLMSAQVRALEEPAEPPACEDLHWNATWTILAVGAIGTAVAMIDDEIIPPADRHPDRELGFVLDAGNVYGEGRLVGGLCLASLSYGALAGSERFMDLGEDLTLSFLGTGLATGVLKFSVNRHRPNGGEHSFPSGHTSSAASTVVVLWRHLGWRAGVPAAIMTGVTGAARIEAQKHYLSDVIAGATVGLVMGRLVTGGRDKRDGWTLGATAGGLSLSRAF